MLVEVVRALDVDDERVRDLLRRLESFFGALRDVLELLDLRGRLWCFAGGFLASFDRDELDEDERDVLLDEDERDEADGDLEGFFFDSEMRRVLGDVCEGFDGYLLCDEVDLWGLVRWVRSWGLLSL